MLALGDSIAPKHSPFRRPDLSFENGVFDFNAFVHADQGNHDGYSSPPMRDPYATKQLEPTREIHRRVPTLSPSPEPLGGMLSDSPDPLAAAAQNFTNDAPVITNEHAMQEPIHEGLPAWVDEENSKEFQSLMEFVDFV